MSPYLNIPCRSLTLYVTICRSDNHKSDNHSPFLVASCSIFYGYLMDKCQLMQSDKLFAGNFCPVGVEHITIFVAFFGEC